MSTDDLEDGLDQQEEFQLAEGDLTFLETPATNTNTQSTPSRTMPTHTHPDMSPIQTTQPNFIILPKTRNVPPKLRKRIEPTWKEKPVSVRKFVDDNLQVEKKKCYYARHLEREAQFSRTLELSKQNKCSSI